MFCGGGWNNNESASNLSNCDANATVRYKESIFDVRSVANDGPVASRRAVYIPELDLNCLNMGQCIVLLINISTHKYTEYFPSQ